MLVEASVQQKLAAQERRTLHMMEEARARSLLKIQQLEVRPRSGWAAAVRRETSATKKQATG